jgi:GNAT superfamily N-acetyltransferase
MPVRIVVTRANPDDWVAYRSIRLEALADAPHAFESTHAGALLIDEQGWRERLAGSAVFLASLDGARVGLAAGIVEDGSAELVSMWVRAGSRGAGVGSHLVSAVTGWAAAAGFDVIGLWISAGNDPAERLYARHGFSRTGEVQPVVPGNPERLELRMSRRLDAGAV